MRRVSSTPLILPAAGVDSQVDEAVLRGQVVILGCVTLPAPRLAWPHGPRVSPDAKAPQVWRTARTKGATFRRYPEGRPRAEWREIERQLCA